MGTPKIRKFFSANKNSAKEGGGVNPHSTTFFDLKKWVLFGSTPPYGQLSVIFLGVCKKQVFIGGLLKIAFNKVSQNKSQRHWTLFLLLPLKANFENLSSKLAGSKHSGSLSKEQIGT